ncbi:hypothetical protein AAVH_03083 [Aphelenchoides avenae]|nr:hypothetical protein AAVH_03083 [Aphelenchus avenae]
MTTNTLQQLWLVPMKGSLGNRLSLAEASVVRARDMRTAADPLEDAAVDCEPSVDVFDWLEPDHNFSACALWEVPATALTENSSVPFSPGECPVGASVCNLDLTTPEDVNELMPVVSDSPSAEHENQHDLNCPWEEAVWDDVVWEEAACDDVVWEEAVWDEVVSPPTLTLSDNGCGQLHSNEPDPSEPPRTAAALSPDARTAEPDTPSEEIQWEKAIWDETIVDDTSASSNSGSQLCPTAPNPSAPPSAPYSCISEESGNVATGQCFKVGSTTEARNAVMMEGIPDVAGTNGASENCLRQEQSATVPRQDDTDYSNELPDDYDALDVAAQRIRESVIKHRSSKASRNVGDDPSRIDLFVDVEQASTSASSLAQNRVTARRPASGRVRKSETKAAVEAIAVPTKKARRGRKPKDLVMR